MNKGESGAALGPFLWPVSASITPEDLNTVHWAALPTYWRLGDSHNIAWKEWIAKTRPMPKPPQQEQDADADGEDDLDQLFDPHDSVPAEKRVRVE